MSVKLDLYQAIKTLILSLTDEDDEPLVATFGHWNDQFNQIESEIQFRFPAAFVEFSSLEWKTDVSTYKVNEAQQQRANCEIILHLGLKNLNKESDAFEEDVVIIDEICQQLNTLSGDNFTPLVRISERDDTNKGNIRSWIVVFRCLIQETGIYKGLLSQTVPLKITTNYDVLSD